MVFSLTLTLYSTLAKWSHNQSYESHTIAHQYPKHTWPNYVSSLADESDPHFVHHIQSQKNTTELIDCVSETYPKSKLIYQSDDQVRDFLWFRIVVGKYNFYDDLKIIKCKNRIDIVSASRVGYSDLGVNRTRVDKLRGILK